MNIDNSLFVQKRLVSLCTHCVCLVESMQAMLMWLSIWLFNLTAVAHISATDGINLSIDLCMENYHLLYSVIEPASVCCI